MSGSCPPRADYASIQRLLHAFHPESWAPSIDNITSVLPATCTVLVVPIHRWQAIHFSALFLDPHPMVSFQVEVRIAFAICVYDFKNKDSERTPRAGNKTFAGFQKAPMLCLSPHSFPLLRVYLSCQVERRRHVLHALHTR